MKKEDKELGFGVIYYEKIKPFCGEFAKAVKGLSAVLPGLFPEKAKLKFMGAVKLFKIHTSYDVYCLYAKGIKSFLPQVLCSLAMLVLCFFVGRGFFGTLFLCIFGFVVGWIIGHFIEMYRNPQSFLIYAMLKAEKPLAYAFRSKEVSMRAFVCAFTCLLGKVAACDEKITSDEEDLYLSFISSRPDEEKDNRKMFGKSAFSSELSDDIAQIKLILSADTTFSPVLLHLLFSMAAADKKEFNFIKNIADNLNITQSVFLSVSSSYYKEKPKRKDKVKRDDFEVLGLDRTATKDEIRRAWITLVQENHPDRLSGTGADSSQIEEANELLAEINAAYNRLMKI